LEQGLAAQVDSCSLLQSEVESLREANSEKERLMDQWSSGFIKNDSEMNERLQSFLEGQRQQVILAKAKQHELESEQVLWQREKASLMETIRMKSHLHEESEKINMTLKEALRQTQYVFEILSLDSIFPMQAF